MANKVQIVNNIAGSITKSNLAKVRTWRISKYVPRDAAEFR